MCTENRRQPDLQGVQQKEEERMNYDAKVNDSLPSIISPKNELQRLLRQPFRQESPQLVSQSRNSKASPIAEERVDDVILAMCDHPTRLASHCTLNKLLAMLLI